eukprot:TRINITY_DN14839_c0_g2_i1.p1 TRINITY_DN14839_c0_g2~~TRINITY_DN14839_c0_g2_i1.p1  ORF type:complete len:629 (+),score=249.84 TRINITY_DN14839_c0_g2_i1:75-1961(+)
MHSPSQVGRAGAQKAAAGPSLRELTKAALMDMLSGGRGQDKVDWTVLIFDDFARDLIAPILKVGELRRMGVTLFLKVDGVREAIPDAPAVYLCQPTAANIKLIGQDVVNNKYRSYNVHFTSPVTRKNLELLAVELQGVDSIANVRVKDQFLSFVAPEKDLFTLQVPSSYYTIGSVHTTQEQIGAYFEELTNGIIHVLLMLQMVPIVVYVNTDPAEELARAVTARIKDTIREHYLAPHAEVARPVLIICDRNSDLATPLIQPFTYRALLHDTLNMALNKVRIGSQDYELDPRDSIWNECAGAELPDVMEKTAEAVDEMKKKKAELGVGQDDDVQAQTQALTRVMESATSISEQNRFLTTHSTLQTELDRVIREGKLDQFNGVAEEIVFQGVFQNPKIKELCMAKDAPMEQRVRLALLQYLLSDPDNKAAMDFAKDMEMNLARHATAAAAPGEGEDAAAAAAPATGGDDVQLHLAYKYLRKVRGFSMPQKEEKHGKAAGLNFLKGGLLGKSGAGQLMQGLIGSNQKLLPHTRIVDAVLQGGAGKRSEERQKILRNLNCIDPKTGQSVSLGSLTFNTALCFVIGGGNYFEYEDMKAWERAEENRGKSVFYGATELTTGNNFLNQLSHLGQE